MTTASVIWRRLDAPGHDACRLEGESDGWVLDGTAVFRDEGVAARLDYQVRCDRSWRSRSGKVQGWIGAKRVSVSIVRDEDGTWHVDGAPVDGLEGCVDLDLGF